MLRKRILPIWIIIFCLLLLAVIPSRAEEDMGEETLPKPAKIILSSKECTYNGKERTPGVTVYDTEGNVIEKENYKLTYSAGRKNVGKYTVKATFKNNDFGSLSATYKIIPQKPVGLVLSSKPNQICAKWTKITRQISGYQIAYSKSSTFAKEKTTFKKIKGGTNCSYNIKSLPVGATYYVRVRAYKDVDGKAYCSVWSSAKKIVIHQNKETLNAKSAIIMEAGSKNILFQKNINTRRANASTTKLMTAILALEKKDLNSPVKITQEAVNTPWSTLGAGVSGDSIRMNDLLHMLLIPSDNGAAVALASHVSGSTSAFVKKMNQKAANLGMKNTNFKNPHGLDTSGHYSSAKDLAILADYCMKNPDLAKIVKKQSYSFQSINRKISYKVYTKNLLLGKISGVVGLKTGTEASAGNCFICAYKQNKKLYITVVMGCSTENDRWNDTRKLISYIDRYL